MRLVTDDGLTIDLQLIDAIYRRPNPHGDTPDDVMGEMHVDFDILAMWYGGEEIPPDEMDQFITKDQLREEVIEALFGDGDYEPDSLYH